MATMNCEIEFLPVGEGSKAGDAIVVRYGTVDSYELMIVDGGHGESGELLVEHIKEHFGDSAISHVVLTHSDADHASGLRTVLSELTVNNLWLHVPWAHAAAARPYFKDKRWTDDGLQKAIWKEYDLINEIVQIALDKKIAIHFPFIGEQIGPFSVLSPSSDVYKLLLPQFDRTPEADQAAIEATGWWIGKAPSALAKLAEKVVAKVQKWFTESWEKERLKDGGVATASNESSVVLYADFGETGRFLLTGDAGARALSLAAYFAGQANFPLQDFTFVQIPHHGSRRNVGPTILNLILGPIQAEGSPIRFAAFVSAPKDDDIHPRMMVLNAFTRRGARVIATQGVKKIHWGGFPVRPKYSAAEPIPFTPKVEDYD
jgi:beta-lactamase superfamily II metal-dependent hydrolase